MKLKLTGGLYCSTRLGANTFMEMAGPDKVFHFTTKAPDTLIVTGDDPKQPAREIFSPEVVLEVDGSISIWGYAPVFGQPTFDRVGFTGVPVVVKE